MPKARVRAPVDAASLAVCCPHLHYAIRGAQGVLLCERVGGTTSQLDRPSLMSFSVAGCSRLQLRALHWAASVALLQVVDN